VALVLAKVPGLPGKVYQPNALIQGLMAAELRWEVLTQTVADTVTTSNAGAEFRNDTAKLMHIRVIDGTFIYNAAAPTEIGGFQLAKQNSVNFTNNGTGFRLEVNIGIGATGAAPVDGVVTENQLRMYAQGQVTLEQNESLFDSISKSSGGVATSRWLIGFHF